MNNTKRIVRTTIIFAALTIAGVCLIALPQSNVLQLAGTALFSSALTYFLVEITRIVEPQ